METYKLHVAGLERDLPICPLNDNLSIAGFVMFGDVEMTIRSAEELLKRVGDFDLLITAESKGIPLAYEMSRQSGKKYILARKSIKLYTYKTAQQVAGIRHPQTTRQAKFSTAYCVASTLLRGTPSEADFSNENVNEADVKAREARIETAIDEETGKALRRSSAFLPMESFQLSSRTSSLQPAVTLKILTPLLSSLRASMPTSLASTNQRTRFRQKVS